MFLTETFYKQLYIDDENGVASFTRSNQFAKIKKKGSQLSPGQQRKDLHVHFPFASGKLLHRYPKMHFNDGDSGS